MKTSKFIVIVIAIIVVVAISFFVVKSVFKEDEETETMYCGSNNTLPVKVFKNPTKAFPAFAKEFNLKINNSVELIDSVDKKIGGKGSSSTELNSHIIELRDKLNQESTRMEMIMKSNFLAYNSKPCDEQISKEYFELLRLMADKNAELERFKAELTKPASKGGDSTKVTIETDTTRLRNALEHFMSNYRFTQ